MICLFSGLPNITQMSAVYGDRTFNRYIVPEKPISYGASLVTNLSSKDGKLYKNGVLIMDSIQIKTCLTDLMSFLRDIENPVLVAHNAETFDAMVLCNKIIQCNISFEGVIKGFIDTLTVFRSYLPGHKCYKQEVLVRESGINYNAHDSLEDCRALEALIKHHNISVEFMIDSSFTYEYALSKCRYRIQKDVNLQSLTPLVEKKVITQYMASKIASSGLSYSHLKTVCSRDAFQGLYSIFREDVKGVPRVTKNTKIVIEICIFFQ